MQEYLSFASEVLADAVSDGALDADDYAFQVIAMGERRLQRKALADVLRQEENARLARETVKALRGRRTERTRRTDRELLAILEA